jgi:hypothetical protein
MCGMTEIVSANTYFTTSTSFKAVRLLVGLSRFVCSDQRPSRLTRPSRFPFFAVFLETEVAQQNQQHE